MRRLRAPAIGLALLWIVCARSVIGQDFPRLDKPVGRGTASEAAGTRERFQGAPFEFENIETHAPLARHLPPTEMAGEVQATPASFADQSAGPSGYEVGSDLAFRARWNNGLFFETANGDFKSHVGCLIQQDWTWFNQAAAVQADPAIGNLQDGVFFRRGRVRLDGTAYEQFEWDFDCELIANSFVAFDDLWIGMKELPWIGNLRVGHVKIPMGVESVTSNRVFTFTERATMFDAFLPEYGPGFLAFNGFADGRGTWAACFHRLDARSDGVDTGDGEYNGTGRLSWLPWCAPDDRYYLHLGGAFSFRAAKMDSVTKTDVVRFRARPEFRDAQLLPRFVDTGNIGSTGYMLSQCEAALVYGPASLQAEYVQAMVNPSAAGLGDLNFHGGYVLASYFLTGESRPYDHRSGRFARLRPQENFWLTRTENAGVTGGRGAWELAARYSRVDLNDGPVRGGVLEDVTLGVNWYHNYSFRVQWNYVLSHREVDAPRASGDTHGFVMRFSFDI